MDAARIIPPELAGAVRLGWTPEPVRQIALPGAIEEILGGGLPRGRLCEIVGARGSGRTSLVYSLLAAATAAAEISAVVDAADAFDPAGAARASIDLGAVLWVRPPSVRDALRCAELILAAGGFAVVVLDLDGVPLRRLRFYTWPRLARAAEKAGTALVILAPERLAGSFAAMSVMMRRSSQEPGARSQKKGDGRQSTTRSREASGSWLLPPDLFTGFESHGVLVHNKRGPLRASRRVRWTLWPEENDLEGGGELKIQNSKLETREAR